jgi:4'-phosphopantetheinyl transferase
MPGPDSADIWLIPTDQPPDVVAHLASLLDPDERRRAAEFAKPGDRRQFTAAHGAMRVIVGQCLGAPPADLGWNRGPHGKPEPAGRWTGVRANLSTCAELAMLAVTQSRDVGVDLEIVRPEAVALRMSARYFPPAEARFVAGAGAGAGAGAEAEGQGPAERFARLWCRKEACVKVHGARLVEGMRLPVAEPGPLVVRDPTGALPGSCRVQDVSAPTGFRAAVALGGERHFTIRWRVWLSGDQTAMTRHCAQIPAPALESASISGL